MKDLKSKTVLVTGASSGKGEAFSNQLAEKGANLIIVARSQNDLQTLAESIKQKYSVQCYPIAMDLAKENAAKELFDKISSLKLGVDVLINNAGFGAIGNFEEYDFDKYKSMLQLNINTLTELCWLYLPSMKKKNSGGIINVASTASFLPIPFSAVYAGSKSYVLNFSESLFEELLKTDVTVTCLCPAGPKLILQKSPTALFPITNPKSLTHRRIVQRLESMPF